eukprot:gene17790-18010_t
MPREGLDFASNDYLALAGSPRLKQAIISALEAGCGAGATGSRLLRGNAPEHERLERDAAAFFRTERALFFGNGYMANFAVLTTLPQKGDLILLDELIHASAREGAAAGRAQVVHVAHNDAAAFDEAISSWRRNGGIGAPWIVVESIYSMDGDFAPLAALAEIAERHDGFLYVDEAHATGIFGPEGRGLVHFLEGRDNVVALHTCGKALGGSGALVNCCGALADYMINRGRPFIYSTAPAPVMAAAARESLKILQDEPERRLRLQALIEHAHKEAAARFGTRQSQSQILPLIIGDNARTMRLAGAMQARGFDLRGIRPPTVPEGTARLRLSITLHVGTAEISALFDELSRQIRMEGTDTGIGKTTFAAGLAGMLQAAYWKPVQSGLDDPTDSRTVAELSRLPPQFILPESYRLTAPLSPHRAAELDGLTIDTGRLQLPQTGQPLIIEGAGGLMVPLNRQLLSIDQFKLWGLPVVLCARTALGTINHSLLSFEALRQRGIPILGIVFIGEENADSQRTICDFGKVRELGRLPWLNPLNPDALAAAMRAAFRPQDFLEHAVEPPPPVIAATDKAHLVTQDGRRILDAISSWWVITHGHRHPKIMAAIAEASTKFDQIIFAGMTHEPAERLADALVEIAPPGLNHVFFSDSGSTSVECAVKMALGYHKHRGNARARIAVLQHSYHGDTIGAMSMGERGVFNAAYEPLLFAVDTLPFPAAGHEQATLDRFEAVCKSGDIAALLVEPLILGAGGMLIYAPWVLTELSRIAAKYGAIVIADEVMTGWGRTGSLFACEQANVAPDILCTSKGLTGGSVPLAATLATDAIFDAHFSPDRSKAFFHSSSYTANPIACAAALANIDVWRQEPVAARIENLARRQQEHVRRFAGDARFTDVRSLGTITALDLAGSSGYLAEAGQRLRAFFLARDMLIRPLGNIIYVLPPYCIDDGDLSRLYDAIDECAAFSGDAR